MKTEREVMQNNLVLQNDEEYKLCLKLFQNISKDSDKNPYRCALKMTLVRELESYEQFHYSVNMVDLEEMLEVRLQNKKMTKYDFSNMFGIHFNSFISLIKDVTLANNHKSFIYSVLGFFDIDKSKFYEEVFK